MTFHDKAALTDSFNEHNPPIHDSDSEFDRLLAILDESLEDLRREEAKPVPPCMRGIVRWFLR